MLKASIIICTRAREERLKECLESIKKQSYNNYEIIIIDEIGSLPSLKNKGAKKATGDILIFIDDDVVVTSGWLEGIMRIIKRPKVGGVSGPTIIVPEYRKNRNIFKHKLFSKFYCWLFLNGKQHLPGRITKAGTFTWGSMDKDCNYVGEVDYLEACNMAVRKEAFDEVEGFDEKYRGLGDWSEPDLAFRIREAGWKLRFTPLAKVYHNTCEGGAHHQGKRKRYRMANYEIFSKRFIKPHWKHSLFKIFLKTFEFIEDYL